jgi:hypothetical protein
MKFEHSLVAKFQMKSEAYQVQTSPSMQTMKTTIWGARSASDG